jgi:glycosyltransferase involved in cell wall biosynthesis
MIIPADRTGCGSYRLIWPGQAVAMARPNWRVDIVPPESVEAGFSDGRLVGIRGFPDPLPDVLVMQRVGTPGQLAVIKWAHERGVATVIDFDDAMWCIDRGNTAWASWNRANEYNQHWRICDDAVKYADLVTVTTKGLADRYGRTHHRTEVLPNCIPKAVLGLPNQDNEIFTAGWAGFTLTHPGDCKVSKPAIEAVLEAGGRLRVIADAAGAAREWGIDPALVDSIPSQKLGPRYFQAIGALDLMLVGLRDTKFNHSKSFLKVLEAAARGVPAIAADNAPHRVLAKTGFPVTLASSPSEWYDAAKVFATMPEDDRRAMANLVWLAVEENWTIEGNAERWAAAWERAAARRG